MRLIVVKELDTDALGLSKVDTEDSDVFTRRVLLLTVCSHRDCDRVVTGMGTL